MSIFGPVKRNDKLAIGGIGNFGETIDSAVGDDGNKDVIGQKLVDEFGKITKGKDFAATKKDRFKV